MDIDLLKSTPDDEIEMMFMTMHMARHAASGGPLYADTAAMMSFDGGARLPQYYSPPTFLGVPQTTMSFSNSNTSNNNNFSSSLLPSSFPLCRDNSNENGTSFPPNGTSQSSQKQASMASMREMIFRMAAMQPIYVDPEAVKPPKRRNVRISKDPQSVAARHRRERISERIRTLQRLVPGGTKMDTASMLDEAIHYVKFLKGQVQSLERDFPPAPAGLGFPVAVSSGNGYYSFGAHQLHMNAAPHNVQQFSDSDA